MDFKIENQNIGISETVYSDIDFIIDIENREENNIFITAYAKDRHIQVIESKDEQHLTVWDKNTNEIIGFIILAGLENTNLSLEFRRIVVKSKGKGFGRQCLQLTKEYCFDRLKFHRLWLDVFDDNERAISLYKSEGFQVDGHLRDIIKQGEKYRTLILLSILESEHSERNKNGI
jgi:diamine N-acetyltransferase